MSWLLFDTDGMRCFITPCLQAGTSGATDAASRVGSRKVFG